METVAPYKVGRGRPQSPPLPRRTLRALVKDYRAGTPMMVLKMRLGLSAERIRAELARAGVPRRPWKPVPITFRPREAPRPFPRTWRWEGDNGHYRGW